MMANSLSFLQVGDHHRLALGKRLCSCGPGDHEGESNGGNPCQQLLHS